MNAKKEWGLVNDMMSGVFDDGWVTINGTHVLIGEGGEVKGGPAALKNLGSKKTKKAASASSSGSSEAKSKKHQEAVNHVLKKDFHFSDLDYKNSDSLDYFENDRGGISVGGIDDALNKAYNAGVERAKKTKSISAAQIEKAVKKETKNWVGFSLEDKNRDGYDYWSNDRGSFSNYDLQHALESMYGAGFSSGDNYRSKAGDEMSTIMDMLAGDFDPGQPRDENGRWTDTGSGGDYSDEDAGAKATVSETSTHGKIVDMGSGQWYGENDDGSSVSILDSGKDDYNLWKYGSRQIYEVQPVDKDLNWGEKEYYSKKSEAMAAAKGHLKRMAGK